MGGLFSLGIDGKGGAKLGKSALLSVAGVVGLKLANGAGLIPADMAADPQTAMEWGAILCAGITWGVNFIRKMLLKYPPQD